MDLTADTMEVIESSEREYDYDGYERSGNLPTKYKYGTGLAFEIPDGHVGLIFPRSSIYKTNERLANCVGVIDSDYRGEVSFIFDVIAGSGTPYIKGDRIGQLMIVRLPDIEVQEVEELSDTVRGSGGYGSTGK